ncbi:Rap30/74 interaction domain-containing protein [Cylindrobasidium torrendii FP15055 ss-10]|uniref:Rap30/74 interaction domain-containing protein n=1 Tax=Cylindrobasidium torrendii FP15055 ss-10 TaxID=1314674 RepID=A0A0D7BLM2_9AGAR|nr:Rap30/74 interaction domain-containing protein [Cylindrobasidium torrendii FP15055 ss-10]
MAPKKDPKSFLFHTKKKKQPSQAPSPSASNGQSSQRKSMPPPPSRPSSATQAEDDDGLDIPPGGFAEYKVLSSALNGWKYDVMKFDSRKPVDIFNWQPPIKLNRKDIRRDDGPQQVGPLTPMIGLDGKPVIGPGGTIVMMDINGRPVNPAADTKKDAPPGKRKFQKKTRQVFLLPEATKQLRKEERYPWVMEDASGQETWLAQLDDASKAETRGFFMPAANDVFKFVPAHRWYKFQKKLNHQQASDTQAMEAAYTRNSKRDPSTWFQKNLGRAPSAATQAMLKGEADDFDFGGNSMVVRTAGPSQAARPLRKVDKGLFGDEDDDGRPLKREDGQEGDYDEIVYDEDFADDDDQMHEDGNEEEKKDLDDRLKREYKQANKTQEGYIDADMEVDKPKMTKTERRMKRLLRAREGNDAYDSDDSQNMDDESSDEEEEAPPPKPPTPEKEKEEAPVASGSQPTTAVQPSSAGGPMVLDTDVRATSPTSPNLGGHSLLAKRATSPKPGGAPKIKLNGSGSRPGSPAHSPPGSRATSPTGSPSPAGVNGKKRKAEDDSTANPAANGERKRKRKAVVTGAPVEITEKILVDWIRERPEATTKECIGYFTPWLQDPATKKNFTKLVAGVAVLKGGSLTLREKYRNTASAAPSPAA